MFHIFLFCLSLCFCCQTSVALFAEKSSTDDLAMVDQLIAATEKSLQKQKEVRALLVQYKQAEQDAIKNSDDAKKVARLITLGSQMYASIQGAYLEEYFSPQFIEELKTLSEIGEKKQIPSPK